MGKRRRLLRRGSLQETGSLRLWGVVLLAGLLLGLYAYRFWLIGSERRDLARLGREQVAAQAEEKRLRDRLALKDDPKTIERLAREELGLVRPNEEKVVFVPPEGGK